MRLLNKFFGVVIVLALSVGIGFNAFAQEKNPKVGEKQSIIVISDRVEQANQQYFIYPQVSEMVAAEVINELNKDAVVTAPALSTVREKLRSQKLLRSSSKLLDNYRYTYELNFSALKKIAKEFNVTNVLIVTGSLDTVSDFLKPTWWNFLNIPGENIVKTEYRLYTYIALVDLKTETITWQNTYHRQITAPEFALANATYSPDYRQLTKLKKASAVIAQDATYRVENVLTPWFTADKTPPTLQEKVKFNVNKKYDACIQNINEKKSARAAKQAEQNAVLKTQKNKRVEKLDESLVPNLENSVVNRSKKVGKNEPKMILQETLPVPAKTTSHQQSSDESKNIQVSPLNIIIPKM